MFGQGATKPNPVVAAVFLEAVDGVAYADATSFQPVFVLDDESLVNSGLELGWVSDSSGNRSVPLSPDTVTFAGWAAFPQPGKVVLMNLRSGKVHTVAVPSMSIEQVRWNGTNAVVASGDQGAWSIDVEALTPSTTPLPKGYAGANDVITVDPQKGTSVTTWKLDGLQKTSVGVSAPATGTSGSTRSTNLIAATGVYLEDGFDQVGGKPAYQGILSVPIYDATARKLLVMGESPMRQKGCCQVAGFFDKRTLMYTNITAEGVWLLAWHTETGQVGRTFLLKADPAVPPVLSYALSMG
ncbi:MAG: hypothetical protein L0H96_04880 [Humibacillus sp.]|nr:hypothetical protein [Humibacillus sp.]MDN5776224.1 hypothetical protein [Humibacillus sp.]